MILLKINTWSELLVGAAIGILVVFAALTILVLMFEMVQAILLSSTKRRLLKSGKKKEEIVDVAAYEIVAISMALHLYMNDTHDQESNVMTIKRIERRYSPWSSKIYGLNNTIRK